jgi:hypothetical protein
VQSAGHLPLLDPEAPVTCPYCPSRWCDCGYVQADGPLDDAQADAERQALELLGYYDAEDFEPDDLNDSDDWQWSPDHQEGA